MHKTGTTIAALTAGLVLGFATMASADAPKPGNDACPGGAPCTMQKAAPGHKAAPAGQKSMAKTAPKQQQDKVRKPQNHVPRIGESARRAPMLQQARDSRLPPPPKGQHYRVLDDRIVRVDDQTAKIVAIIGLTSALLGSN